MKPLKIGLLGCGRVGRGLVDLIRRNRGRIEERYGLEISLTKILVRDLGKDRGIERSLLTGQPQEVLESGCQIVVELMGGLEPARSLLLQAVQRGKSVVTANKALLARGGPELFRAASENGVNVGFEASVCGAIPLIRSISCGLSGNRIRSIVGIVNGTCNYILDRVQEGGLSFHEALKEAQAEGFAEADPSLDLDGVDAAQKLTILAQLAFGVRVDPGELLVEGMRHLGEEDIQGAREFGFAIKHVAIARDLGEFLDLRAHPVLLSPNHPLARVRGENNAVQIQGDAAGDIFLKGKGAGPFPTAGAVLSDILAIACRRGSVDSQLELNRKLLATGRESGFYLRFSALDFPGAFGKIASVLGSRGIGIERSAITQSKPGFRQLKFLTFSCKERALRRAIEEIDGLKILENSPVAIRIHEEALPESLFIDGIARQRLSLPLRAISSIG